MDIPFSALSKETLRAVIEEYVTREGTDYGLEEFSLEQKIAQVKAQLEHGEIRIDYDPESQTCNLRPSS